MHYNSIYRKKLVDLLKTLVPDQLFVIKYCYKTYVDYVLNIRTLERVWDFKTDTFEYYDNIPTIDNLENYYQNCFGLYSNKSFNSLDDEELNMFLAMSYGKEFNEMSIPILERFDQYVLQN